MGRWTLTPALCLWLIVVIIAVVGSTLVGTAGASDGNLAPTSAPLPPPPATIGHVDPLCPVTVPTGTLRTFENPHYPANHGTDGLWTDLWPDGTVLIPSANAESDGSLGIKWGWWREARGRLTIEGRRLD